MGAQRRPGAWVLLTLLLAGCGVHGLAFRHDTRLSITAPQPRAPVTLPVTVTWEVDGFRVIGLDGAQLPDAGVFGVFVDGSPQPPGQPLAWFARDDETCRAAEGCPDAQYLAGRGVYTTTATRFKIAALPPRPVGSRRAEIHDVTISFLDGTGRRIGESAFSVSFEVVRKQAQS